MLEFDGPMGQCFSSFATVSQRSRRRREKKEERYKTDTRVYPNGHILHLQVQLAFAWCNQLVLDRGMCTVSWYSCCSLPTLQR